MKKEMKNIFSLYFPYKIRYISAYFISNLALINEMKIFAYLRWVKQTLHLQQIKKVAIKHRYTLYMYIFWLILLIFLFLLLYRNLWNLQRQCPWEKQMKFISMTKAPKDPADVAG